MNDFRDISTTTQKNHGMLLGLSSAALSLITLSYGISGGHRGMKVGRLKGPHCRP